MSTDFLDLLTNFLFWDYKSSKYNYFSSIKKLQFVIYIREIKFVQNV